MSSDRPDPMDARGEEQAFERELVEALRPLDRSARETVRDVLAALPPAPWAGEPAGDDDPPPDRNGRPNARRPQRQPEGAGPRPWWWIAAALAAGFLLGWLVGQWLQHAPPLSQQGQVAGSGAGSTNSPDGGPVAQMPGSSSSGAAGSTPNPDLKPDPVAGGPAPAGPGASPMPGERRDKVLEVRLLGPVTITEPGEQQQTLLPNRYLVPPGTRFDTMDSRVGGLAYPEDTLFRLDRATVATIGPARSVQITQGTVWIAAMGPEMQAIDVPGGSLEFGKGAVMVTVDGRGTEVLVLEGDARVHANGGADHSQQTRDTERGYRIGISNGGLSEPQPAGFTGPETGWMTEFILLQLDPTERVVRTDEMVKAFEDERTRDVATRELLRLGSVAVSPLLAVVRDNRERDVRIAAANVIRRVADFGSAAGLIPWLAVDDDAIRERVFDTLVRITGTDVGTSARFWREAASDQRQAAMSEWQAYLDGR